MTDRGLVIAGMYECIDKGDAGVEVTGMPEEVILSNTRAALLYWDKMDIPANDFIPYSLPYELNYLEQEKILVRSIHKYGFGFSLGGGIGPDSQFFGGVGPGSKISFQGLTIGGIPFSEFPSLNSIPAQIFAEKCAEKNVLWSYLKNADSVDVPEEHGEPGRSFLVDLHNMLPYPENDVPFETILNFKEKRKSELSALRSELDESYQKVSMAEDVHHAQALQLDRLQHAITDLQKVARENFRTRFIKSLKHEIRPVAAISTAAATVPLTIGAGALTSAAVGAVAAIASGVSISLNDMVFGSKLPDRLVPYKYILEVEKEWK